MQKFHLKLHSETAILKITVLLDLHAQNTFKCKRRNSCDLVYQLRRELSLSLLNEQERL